MDIPILYEDDDVVVINKPSGVSAHQDGRIADAPKDDTLADWFVQKFPEAKDVGEAIVTKDGDRIEKPGIVHRLDKGTSGVMVLVKNQKAYEFLKEQFQGRLVEKTYRAFVWGNVKRARGIISLPIGKSRSDFRKRSAEPRAKPPLRESQTDYQMLLRRKKFSYLEAKPKTGRTHQIRVHFKALSHPIVGDMLYAPKKEEGLGFKRLALHAFSIAITLPSGEEKVFEAPLPDDFISAEEELKNIAE